MATKPRNPSFTSPKGTFVFPALMKPDFGNDKFPKPNGEYKTGLKMKLDDPATQAFIAKLAPHHEAALAEGRTKFAELPVATRKKLKELTENPLYATEYDKETEEETGFVVFKFATGASGKNKKGEPWSRKLPVFDAKGKPLAATTAVWGGTVGKINFEVAPYFIPGTGAAGLKMYLNAAQVIDLVSAGQRNAGGYGFGEEEGFEESDPAGDAGFKDESGDSTGTDGGDDQDF